MNIKWISSLKSRAVVLVWQNEMNIGAISRQADCHSFTHLFLLFFIWTLDWTSLGSETREWRARQNVGRHLQSRCQRKNRTYLSLSSPSCFSDTRMKSNMQQFLYIFCYLSLMLCNFFIPFISLHLTFGRCGGGADNKRSHSSLIRVVSSRFVSLMDNNKTERGELYPLSSTVQWVMRLSIDRRRCIVETWHKVNESCSSSIDRPTERLTASQIDVISFDADSCFVFFLFCFVHGNCNIAGLQSVAHCSSARTRRRLRSSCKDLWWGSINYLLFSAFGLSVVSSALVKSLLMAIVLVYRFLLILMLLLLLLFIGADSNLRDYSGKKAYQYLKRADCTFSISSDTFRSEFTSSSYLSSSSSSSSASAAVSKAAGGGGFDRGSGLYSSLRNMKFHMKIPSTSSSSSHNKSGGSGEVVATSSADSVLGSGGDGDRHDGSASTYSSYSNSSSAAVGVGEPLSKRRPPSVHSSTGGGVSGSGSTSTAFLRDVRSGSARRRANSASAFVNHTT